MFCPRRALALTPCSVTSSDHVPAPCCCPRSQAPRLGLKGSFHTNVLILPLHPKPQSKKHLPNRMFPKPKTHISFSTSVYSILENMSSAYSLSWNHGCEVSEILLIPSFRQRKSLIPTISVWSFAFVQSVISFSTC